MVKVGSSVHDVVRVGSAVQDVVRVGSSVQDVVSEWKACSGCGKRALYIVQCLV